VSNTVTVVVYCPLCCRVYRQDVAHKWGGKTRRVRIGEVALRVLCEENGQGRDRDVWVGEAYCADCSLKRVPPVLREAMERWLREGERK
jgi:hypothetical protein